MFHLAAIQLKPREITGKDLIVKLKKQERQENVLFNETNIINY